MTNIYSTRSPIKPVPTENEEIISCYKYFNCFYRVEKMFSYSLGIIMSLFTNALGLLVVAQVILRYVFKSPKVGIEELTPLLALCAKRVFLEPPDRSTESHWRAEIRASGAGPRAIEANTNIKSHLS